jgi:hypothetical protein
MPSRSAPRQPARLRRFRPVRGSQTGSQRRKTPGHSRRQPAIVVAARSLIRQQPATCSDAANAPEERIPGSAPEKITSKVTVATAARAAASDGEASTMAGPPNLPDPPATVDPVGGSRPTSSTRPGKGVGPTGRRRRGGCSRSSGRSPPSGVGRSGGRPVHLPQPGGHHVGRRHATAVPQPPGRPPRTPRADGERDHNAHRHGPIVRRLSSATGLLTYKRQNS